MADIEQSFRHVRYKQAIMSEDLAIALGFQNISPISRLDLNVVIQLNFMVICDMSRMSAMLYLRYWPKQSSNYFVLYCF